MICFVVKLLNIFFLARLFAAMYGAVTTAIVEKLVLVMNPQEHKAFEAFVQQVASFLARPALARPLLWATFTTKRPPSNPLSKRSVKHQHRKH